MVVEENIKNIRTLSLQFRYTVIVIAFFCFQEMAKAKAMISQQYPGMYRWVIPVWIFSVRSFS